MRFYLLIFLILFFSCKKDPEPISGCLEETALNYNPYAVIDNNDCIFSSTTPYEIVTPYGFPDIQIPEGNPMTIEGVALGEKLFKDPILSKNKNIACASCHQQSNAFSDPIQFSFGTDNIQGDRNASSLINLAWNSSFNWDGSSDKLEDQAFEPIRNPKEMDNTWENVELTLNSHDEYPQLFKNVFNINYIDSTHVVKAIAQFERSLISTESKYDKFIKQELQLSASELNGYAIFNSEKGDCFHCHGTQMFMDNLFHNNGLDTEPFLDNGRAIVTGDIMDNGKFKTPTLRNIEFTAPYMHDGRFNSLEEVIDHYNSGGNYSSTVDPLMKKIGIGLQLTNQEKIDLIAFLKTLSDQNFINK